MDAVLCVIPSNWYTKAGQRYGYIENMSDPAGRRHKIRPKGSISARRHEICQKPREPAACVREKIRRKKVRNVIIGLDPT